MVKLISFVLIPVLIGALFGGWGAMRYDQGYESAMQQRQADMDAIDRHYADTRLQVECLEDLLDWAEGYIPVLTVQKITEVRTQCWEEIR